MQDHYVVIMLNLWTHLKQRKSIMPSLDKLKVVSLGIEETFTKIIFPDDRPRCTGKLKGNTYTGAHAKKDNICKQQGTVTIDDYAFCDKHGGERLMDLHLGRTREIPNG